jgi:hypothetical protein
MRQTVGTLNAFLIAQGMAIVIVDFALPMHTAVLCDGGHIGQHAVVLTVIRKQLVEAHCLSPPPKLHADITNNRSKHFFVFLTVVAGRIVCVELREF